MVCDSMLHFPLLSNLEGQWKISNKSCSYADFRLQKHPELKFSKDFVFKNPLTIPKPLTGYFKYLQTGSEFVSLSVGLLMRGSVYKDCI